MVSTGKRLPYVSIKMSSSDDESSEELDYQNENIVCGETDAISRRKPRCLSKNAQMARENRLRKKLYLNKLEREVLSLRNDNKKLNSILKNQSLIIKDLKQEKKYLNSVIANSGDIKNLIRNIHTSTGMSVSSSLDKNLSLNNVYVPKPTESTDSIEDFPSFDCLLSDPNLNMDIYGDITQHPLHFPDDLFQINSPTSSLEDHNYTTQDVHENDDAGVCLHVSKHRVSLEFCSKCSETAGKSWSQL
ncbi:uncharacterized protein [Diabrotica undecimpunctata]|uniref:uncharacterized protein isoform X1 n=1 Tax=Diabrotica undecimpunctata TaxID=50387 RepID=UPI003B642AE4